MALRQLTDRVGRGRLVLLLGVLLPVLAIVLLVAVGPSLPGPKVRVMLGLVDEIERCVREPGTSRLPSAPAASGSWRTEPTLPVLQDEPRAVAIGNRIYVGSGLELSEDRLGLRSRSSLYVFDPRGGTYRRVTDLPVAVDHPVLASYGGRLYAVGGFTDGKPTNRAWRLDPTEGSWTELAPMTRARGAAAGAVIGDRLYVVGGSSRFSDETAPPYGALEVYDFATNTWHAGPAMPTSRHHLGAAAVKGKLYAVGGRAPDDLSVDAVERYDPATERWERLPALPLGVGGLAVLSDGASVIAIAGGDDRERWVTPAVWTLEEAADRWQRLPNLTVGRHGHAAAVSGRRIYVFGGAPCPGYGETTSAESLPVP